jgi:hypothetical protein
VAETIKPVLPGLLQQSPEIVEAFGTLRGYPLIAFFGRLAGIMRNAAAGTLKPGAGNTTANSSDILDLARMLNTVTVAPRKWQQVPNLQLRTRKELPIRRSIWSGKSMASKSLEIRSSHVGLYNQADYPSFALPRPCCTNDSIAKSVSIDRLQGIPLTLLE